MSLALRVRTNAAMMRTTHRSVSRSAIRTRTSPHPAIKTRRFHQQHLGQQQHPSSSASCEAAEEQAGVVWGYGIWGTIVGANALAIWCEFQMTPDQSLLQGLALAEIPTLKEPEPDKERSIPNFGAHASSKLRISIHYR